ncbi:MAG: hypothetical protein PQJ46_09670 [Spirochaetales bacterium]|nr:hypothetical protein [Spirochaetales bacterium]
MTVSQAGSTGSFIPINSSVKLAARNTPDTIVILSPANRALILPNIISSPKTVA